MTRVVIDTNVFVSSFLGGNPRRVIDLWKDGRVVLCLSGSIVDEYVAVLNRLSMTDEEELQELLALFAQEYHLIFTAKTPTLKVVQEDPADNKFFECAVALKAEYIISGDKEVLSVKNYMGINVLSPKDFLRVMG
ncbi:MAG: putative toxin-antitoxin system toxin component, PIN family [Candidatus Aminicenantes bacterium]|nr:putative toxin-antitoxin system toxin component, PIN family [Candidatus Aminicenantes bacterium]